MEGRDECEKWFWFAVSSKRTLFAREAAPLPLLRGSSSASRCRLLIRLFASSSKVRNWSAGGCWYGAEHFNQSHVRLKQAKQSKSHLVAASHSTR
jgi:hypothetical protein